MTQYKHNAHLPPIHLPKGTHSVSFTRKQLEQLASDKISAVFGEAFAKQDDFIRQVRMPQPPLLLTDRVTGIDAEPLSMKNGVIWTETDVSASSWYLIHSRMPMGLFIEAGQADLLLISWLGIDQHNQDQRLYRLLGCNVQLHGELPTVGDTLQYEIHIDRHIQYGAVRLFFFHYDCYINGECRLSVRNGQAGFFTDKELANSAGLMWQANASEFQINPQLIKPKVLCRKHRFNRQDLEKLASGDAYGCFGPGFQLAAAHTRTPVLINETFLLFDMIDVFDVNGGFQQRGYLRAIQNISPQDWFFQGHFKHDPCMPGTLMLDTCLQLAALYLTATGFTLNKDGWRFEPVRHQENQLLCRGQVTPRSQRVVYELFVDELLEAPYPVLYAHLLCTVDGLKAFHTRIGLQLIPDCPLTSELALVNSIHEAKPVIQNEGFTFDYHSLLSCAWGKPSNSFGKSYAVFDHNRHAARLPGPPYHCMSRVIDITGVQNEQQLGCELIAEYDVPADAWYFYANGNHCMPFSVFIETALQPCGWLANFMGVPLTSKQDLYFRNLDGHGVQTTMVTPQSGCIRTQVKVTNIFQAVGMVILSFEVKSYVKDQLIYTMQTTFGYFLQQAFDHQAGLPTTEQQKALLTKPSAFQLDFKRTPMHPFVTSQPRLADPMLLMFDRVSGYWPDAGEQGLGVIRVEKEVNPREWFFKAHFYQDPVQPGSLGLDAMLQVLQFYMLEQGMHHNIEHPQFESIATNQQLTWKYRGQVLPTNQKIVITMEVNARGTDQQGCYAIATASLWVDGKRIYEASGIGMRLLAAKQSVPDMTLQTVDIDVQQQPWLKDHCPTWTVPAVPMMSLVEKMAKLAHAKMPNQNIISVEQLYLSGWVLAEKPVSLPCCVQYVEDHCVQVSIAEFATARVRSAENYPVKPLALKPLKDAPLIENPYTNGGLFHGPAFHLIESLWRDHRGASAMIRADNVLSESDVLNQILLDAMTHTVPNAHLFTWDERISINCISYPALVPRIRFFGPTPRVGMLRCESRLVGFHSNHLKYPKFHIQLIYNEEVWCDLQLVDVLLPIPDALGKATLQQRRDFIRDKQFVKGVGLSEFQVDATRATIATIEATDWLPGFIATLYAAEGDSSTLTKQVAIKDHFAQRLQKHPSRVTLVEEGIVQDDDNQRYHYRIQQQQGAFVITD